MAAVAGFALYPVLIGVLAVLAAILFDLYLRREHAVAQIVRALNRLLHAFPLPPYGELSTSPPPICAAPFETCGQPGGGTACHGTSNVVVVS